MTVNYHSICFYNIGPGANIMKKIITVIYCHSLVIPSFYVIKLYYHGNYSGMAVNYHGKKFYNIGSWL